MVREGLAVGSLLGSVAALVSGLEFAGFSVALRWRRVGAGLAVIAGALATVQLGPPLAVLAVDLLEPVWVWLIRGDTASPRTRVGGSVVLAAILFSAWPGVRRAAFA